MSLTNPESVITEQRLSEFYQGILPYLGGMPEILANKIDRSNIYSTTEKIIGQWTDGKPIYQKTWISTMPNCTTNGTQVTKTFDVGAPVEKYIKIEAQMLGTSDNSSKHIPWYVQSSTTGGALLRTTIVGHLNSASTSSNKNKLILGLEYTSYANVPVQITAHYTKTTDSAQSIGVDTDYSTTEKIIGTWIDGRSIYQKTLNFGALPNGTSTTSATKSMNHGISNLSLVINVFGFCFNSSDNSWAALPYVAGNGSASCGLYGDKTKIYARANYNASGNTTSYITIQYVKTT